MSVVHFHKFCSLVLPVVLFFSGAHFSFAEGEEGPAGMSAAAKSPSAEISEEEEDDLNNGDLGNSKLIKTLVSRPPDQLEQSATPSARDKSSPTKIKKLSQLSLNEKISQLLIVGFTESEMTSALSARLRALKPGGVILFSRNIRNHATLRKLTSSLQSLSLATMHQPLIIGLDEEGGEVVRVPTKARLPSAQTLGRINDVNMVHELGKRTGALLRSVGINMNFAPVLDVSGAGEKSFIGTRSYGGDPELVANLGINFAEGNRAEGIIPTFKHFPGLGNSLADSHHKTPVRNLTLAELIATDLKPFQKATRIAFPNAMMVAHIGLPKIDPSGMPASLSKVMMTDILRQQMKYQGLVITDDLQMGGAGMNVTAAQKAVEAFQAGADMLMIVWSKNAQESVATALRKAVSDGRISLKRLDASVSRILAAKKWLQDARAPAGIPPSSLPIQISKQNTWPEAEKNLSDFNYNIYRQLIRTQIGPLNTKHIIAFSSSARALLSFKKLLGPSAITFHIHAQTRVAALASVIDRNPSATFIFGVAHPENARLLLQLSPQQQARLIIFNQDSEASVPDFTLFKSVIEIGSLGSAPWRALADEIKHVPPENVNVDAPSASISTRAFRTTGNEKHQ